ncbi:hypothetical protein HDE76_000641 [Rhodanobacter sp. ANJX3]|jgi:hypothetical protein|uniref:hypothetical protein n=1 Tax=unclassified Rhodanobacter TaxID=2621553 RepID=UPI0015C6BB45|nr:MULTISPECIES: hypothetical protein [unclassified Rhodanobacter]MBB5357459.1 hypothetical protein [Rhodanobacter sp. ANJX3]NYE27508.1 hypothetical protein [Rhodanobacter sp. K2T2]
MTNAPSNANVNSLFALQGYPPQILAIDTDEKSARIIASNLDGVLDGVQIDQPGNSIYWTNMGSRPNTGEKFFDRDGTIERCDLDGSNHAVLVKKGQIVTPKQLQLDADNGLLYFCDREGMAVMRCRTDGSELTVLLHTGRWPNESADDLRHCVGIALDRLNGYVYWTQKGSPDAGLGRIFRMQLDMPHNATAETRQDVELLIDRLPEPIDLEIDHERHHLYWTDRGNLEGGNSVNRAAITPDGLMDHVVLAIGLQEGIGLAINKAERKVYVGDLSGRIYRVPFNGGSLKEIYRCPGIVTGLAF